MFVKGAPAMSSYVHNEPSDLDVSSLWSSDEYIWILVAINTFSFT